MAGRKPDGLSPHGLARAHRQRLASENGARAIGDVEHEALAVRKNMARLRALREAKEAQEASTRAALPKPPAKKRTKALSK